jgi:hypothetical protein
LFAHTAPIDNWKLALANSSVTDVTSAPIVGAGFGVNQDAKKFGGVLLEIDFEFGLDVVDAGEWKIVGKGAVAGDVEASADLLDLNVVHILDFRKARSSEFEAALEFGVADEFVAGFDGGGFAFDVGENVGDFGNVSAHVSFEFGDLIVGGFESHAFVKFDVLLHMKSSGEILHADVVDIQVVAGGNGANTVEDIF